MLGNLSRRMARSIAMLLFAALVLLGCQKAPLNEDIEAFWRLKEYTSLDDGEVHLVQEHYITVTRQLVMLSTTFDKDSTRYIGRMEYVKDGLRWHDFYVQLINRDNGVKVETELLAPWGLFADDTTFAIEKSNGKVLWLRSDCALLKMERY